METEKLMDSATIGTFEVDALKQHIGKLYAFAGENAADPVTLVNDLQKGILYIDFEFSKVIRNIKYEPIHLYLGFDSISAVDGEWCVSLEELYTVLQNIDPDANIIEFKFKGSPGEENELFISTSMGPEEEPVNAEPLSVFCCADSASSLKSLDPSVFAEKLEAAHIGLSVGVSEDRQVRYVSDGGWNLSFGLQEEDVPVLDEVISVLGCFVSKYKESKKSVDERMGAEARRAAKTRAPEVECEVKPVEPIQPVVQDQPTISIQIDKPKSLKKKGRRKRRSSEELLQDNIEEAKELLTEHGYGVRDPGTVARLAEENQEVPVSQAPATPEWRLEEFVETGCGLLRENILQAAADNTLDHTLLVKAITQLTELVKELILESVPEEGKLHKQAPVKIEIPDNYVCLDQLKTLSMTELLKLFEN